MAIYDINGNVITQTGTINDNSVDAFKLKVGFSNNISTLPTNPNVVKVAVGWDSSVRTLRQGDTYPNGVLWAFHFEAGKYYKLTTAYAYNDTNAGLFVTRNPDNVQNVNQEGFACSSLITPKVGNYGTQDNFIATSFHINIPTNLEPEYLTVLTQKTASYNRSVFRCNKDFWYYWCTSEDVSSDKPYISGTPTIQEMEEPSEALIEADSFGDISASFTDHYCDRFAKSFSGFASVNATTAHDSIYGIRKYDIPQDLSRAITKISSDPADYYLNCLLIGDSITYAASNAGLQNAWRKYISTRLNLGIQSLAVSGTGIIKGDNAFDFLGNPYTSEDYNVEMTGYAGIKTWIENAMGEDNTYRSTFFSGSTVELTSYKLRNTSIAIVALGTNDWGTNGTLGSVDTLDDETTFYGAVYKTYTLLHDKCGIPSVLFVAPFKRENWNQNNSATVPYTIYDMCHALNEIACINSDMYVLDCIDRWYLNYDDTTIRGKSFIDKVHIKPYAHHMFTNDLAKEVRDILSTKGF